MSVCYINTYIDLLIDIVCVNRLNSVLDKEGPVKNFVNSLQQLTNPEMLFRVISASSAMNYLSRHFACH